MTQHLLNQKIKSKISKCLFEINPSDYIRDLRTPVIMLMGSQDEFTKIGSMREMFASIPSKFKMVKIFNANHEQERRENLNYEIVNIIDKIFAVRRKFFVAKDFKIFERDIQNLKRSV